MTAEARQTLSQLPAGREQQWLAFAVAIFSAVLFLALVPFAKVPLGRWPAFIPVYQTALIVNDLITAALLFMQWRVSRTLPLFLLGCGYFFTASMIVAHTLTFPGVFAAEGLLGAGVHSTAWLYMFWHALFPVFVAFYASMPAVPLSRRAAFGALTGTGALAIALVALATAGERFLPAVMQGNHYAPAYHAVVFVVWFSSIAALACLWRKRPRTVLDVWIMVVMWVWICEVALSAVFNAGRFDLGFYGGRIYGLVAASLLLGILIYEWSELYEHMARERIARAQAEATSRAKDQFLAILGHELRNPLAPIVTALQIMRLRDSSALVTERQIIERQVHHMRRLVDDLLDISRLTRGAMELQRSLWEAVDLAERAAEMARPLFDARRHTLVVDVPAHGLLLYVDGDRMVQALCNVLNNAAKFSRTPDRIVLSAERIEADIVFRVADNGIGLNGEIKSQLFQPFSQGPQSLDRPDGGLGLGLAIVHNIIQLHGGTVEAASDGRGTTLTLRIPVAARSELLYESTAAAQVTSATS